MKRFKSTRPKRALDISVLSRIWKTTVVAIKTFLFSPLLDASAMQRFKLGSGYMPMKFLVKYSCSNVRGK